jgi:VWFA-related protein
MRPALLLSLALTALSLLAESPTAATVNDAAAARADATWREVLDQATREKKPVLVFFRTEPCQRCDELESLSLTHPAILRRLPNVAFATLPAGAGVASKSWASTEPGMALFDRSGALRARWPIIPDTVNLGVLIDAAVAVAPHFEHALQLRDAGAPLDAEVEVATALARLGYTKSAREMFEHARAGGATLRATQEEAAPPEPIEPPPLIRILPLASQIVHGRQTVRTRVDSPAVARVAFSLDGQEVRSVDRPPFTTLLDFGAVPERRTIRVVAFDAKGKRLGSDERVVNEAGETFWLRLETPREGAVAGSVGVVMNVRAPAGHRVQRVAVSWNDAQRAALTAAPWQCAVTIPAGQTGVLRAVAELDDGRSTEDAVLLNAQGLSDQVSAQLVGIPITVVRRNAVVQRNAVVPEITAAQIHVREGTRKRDVQSVATAAETPLTIGLLIDVSDSMEKTLPDVQEAAIRFLETILGDRDRAFLISFDSTARLLQPPTADKALLRRQLLATRPDGLTALYDAVTLGLLQFGGVKGRRALVVFTDGLDRTSESTAASVAELAKRMNVPIHTIASNPDRPASPGGVLPGRSRASDIEVLRVQSELKQLAGRTGGTSEALDDLARLPEVFARISAALRAQLLVFVRTDPATRENEWRRIQVEVVGEDLEVRAPEGYYASW